MKKHFAVLFVMAALAGPSAIAQLPGDKSLNLYAVAGMRLLSEKPFGYGENVSPDFIPTLGAGVLWQLKRFQLGGEFTFSDGKKDTDQFGTILTGISANLVAGYTFPVSRNLRLALQTGLGYSLYHLSVTDHAYQGSANLNTTIYHNVVYSIPVSAMVQHAFSNGTYVGLRGGYAFNVKPSEWRYIEGSTTEVSEAGTDGVFVQVLFGGIFTRGTR